MVKPLPHSQGNRQTDFTVTFTKPVRRRTILKTGAGLFVAGAGIGTPIEMHSGAGLTFAKQQIDNVVIQWNNAALQAIRDTNPGPTIGSRALAIVHTAMYDAWTVYDSVALPTQNNAIPKQSRRNWQAIDLSVSFAAYRALANLFPSDVAVFNNLMNALGYDPTDTNMDPTTLSGIGNVAAQAVLTYRQNDGSNQQKGYADTTGYVPKNAATLPLNQINPPVLAAVDRERKSAEIPDSTLGYRCSFRVSIKFPVPARRSNKTHRSRTKRPWLRRTGRYRRTVQR